MGSEIRHTTPYGPYAPRVNRGAYVYPTPYGDHTAGPYADGSIMGWSGCQYARTEPYGSPRPYAYGPYGRTEDAYWIGVRPWRTGPYGVMAYGDRPRTEARTVRGVRAARSYGSVRVRGRTVRHRSSAPVRPRPYAGLAGAYRVRAVRHGRMRTGRGGHTRTGRLVRSGWSGPYGYGVVSYAGAVRRTGRTGTAGCTARMGGWLMGLRVRRTGLVWFAYGCTGVVRTGAYGVMVYGAVRGRTVVGRTDRGVRERPVRRTGSPTSLPL